MRRIALVLSVLALTLIPARGVEAQLSTSIGAGVAGGLGDFGDAYDSGWTLRGQAGLNLLLAGLHAQAGVTRLDGTEGRDGTTIFQGGIGGRLGVGLFFVGANANYYIGDAIENGVGFAPEVGLSFLMLEAVADIRLDDDHMWGVRVALKF